MFTVKYYKYTHCLLVTIRLLLLYIRRCLVVLFHSLSDGQFFSHIKVVDMLKLMSAALVYVDGSDPDRIWPPPVPADQILYIFITISDLTSVYISLHYSLI